MRRRAFSEHEYRTLERLTDLIIPVENGAPGALAAGAPAWIDMLAGVNDQLKKIYVDGFQWLDDAARQREAADFLSLSSAQQTEMLDADRIPPQRDARARARNPVFQLGTPDDGRCLLYERDWHPGHRLSRQYCTQRLSGARRSDCVRAEEERARLKKRRMKDLCALVLVTASLCAVGVASTMPAIVVTAAARSIRPGELVVLTIIPGPSGPVG